MIKHTLQFCRYKDISTDIRKDIGDLLGQSQGDPDSNFVLRQDKSAHVKWVAIHTVNAASSSHSVFKILWMFWEAWLPRTIWVYLVPGWVSSLRFGVTASRRLPSSPTFLRFLPAFSSAEDSGEGYTLVSVIPCACEGWKGDEDSCIFSSSSFNSLIISQKVIHVFLRGTLTESAIFLSIASHWAQFAK